MSDLAQRHLTEARALLDAGDLDGAGQAYVRLWALTFQTAPRFRTAHLYLVREEARELCQRHAPTRAAFAALRDALEPPALDVSPEPSSFADWLSVHEVLDDQEAVLHWFDGVTAPLAGRVSSSLDLCIGTMLSDRGRWADLARLHPDPLGEFEDELDTCLRLRAMSKDMSLPPSRREGALRIAKERPPWIAARLARALRAAGREAELLALVDAALAWDAGPEMWKTFVEVGPSPVPVSAELRAALVAERPPPHTQFLSDRIPWDGPTSAWRSLVRVHQARWRIARGAPIGRHPHADPTGKPIGSRLDLSFAMASGAQFLTPGVLAAVHARLAAPEPRQKLQANRLWADLLASLPLCFNLFGELQQDPSLARRAVDVWWPDAPRGDMALRFAHSPGRGDRTFVGNGTAFDVAFEITRPDGLRGVVGVRCEYHGRVLRASPPAPRALARYTHITERSGAFVDGWREALIGTDLQQIWLDHLLVLAMLQHRSGRWAWGRFVVVAPAANPSIASAVERYRAVLRDDATFGWLPLEEMLGEGSPLLAETRALLSDRYLPK